MDGIYPSLFSAWPLSPFSNSTALSFPLSPPISLSLSLSLVLSHSLALSPFMFALACVCVIIPSFCPRLRARLPSYVCVLVPSARLRLRARAILPPALACVRSAVLPVPSCLRPPARACACLRCRTARAFVYTAGVCVRARAVVLPALSCLSFPAYVRAFAPLLRPRTYSRDSESKVKHGSTHHQARRHAPAGHRPWCSPGGHAPSLSVFWEREGFVISGGFGVCLSGTRKTVMHVFGETGDWLAVFAGKGKAGAGSGATC